MHKGTGRLIYSKGDLNKCVKGLHKGTGRLIYSKGDLNKCIKGQAD